MKENIFILLVLFQIIESKNDTNGKLWNQNRNAKLYPNSVWEDAKLKTNEIVSKYGYPSETHYVTTEDEYILCVHRISKPGGQPYFLLHGILDSSATYILMGPQIGLGYLLYDLGYDVWMGNVRGNRYSRNHTTINPNDESFWQFSWHEIGYYDNPAMIDYVLNVTGYEKLYYTGHSQGTTAFWVMCSKRPEYNEKIILMQALAPVGYMNHVRGPLLRPFVNTFKDLTKSMDLFEFLPHNDFLANLCLNGQPIKGFCLNTLFLVMGPNPKQLNMTMLPIIFHHVPAGSATKQLLHYAQLMSSGRFCEYDYGSIENRKRYKTSIPPKYNLSLITAPVVLHYGLNDYLTEPVDIDRLYKELSNPIGKYQAPIPEFNHIDFIWGIDVRKLVYKRLIQIINDFKSGNFTKISE